MPDPWAGAAPVVAAPPAGAPETVAIPVAMIYDFNLHSGAIGLYAQLLAENTDLPKAARAVRRMHKAGDVLDWLNQLDAGGYLK
jgi:hypothetical protein